MAKKIPDDFEIDWDLVNGTELLSMAKKIGLPGASAAASREQRIPALQTFESIDTHNPLDDCRATMSEWLERYWHLLRMQAPRDECPNCHLCPDAQVAMSYLVNRDQMT